MNVKDSIRRIDMIMLEMGTLQETRGRVKDKIDACRFGNDFEREIMETEKKKLGKIQCSVEVKKKLIHKIISEIW